MITYETALRKILTRSVPLSKETVSVEDALGYVLAGILRATTDLPRFNASAVDGYAVEAGECASASDTAVRLILAGSLVAGRSLTTRLKPGTAARILTGALLPAGASAVAMQEDAFVDGRSVWIKRSVKHGENVRWRGDEFKRGTRILSGGTVITPAVVALLATLGERKVRVFSKPTVAVLVTGDELHPIGSRLPKGGVYDSNSAALFTSLHAMGITSIRAGRHKDRVQRLRGTLKRMLEEADVIITTGGVSVGERDYVRDILTSLGVQTVFWSIAMKPGKPVFFGTRGRTLVFGLPGNPVSVLVSFQQLVRPALLKLMGSSRPEGLAFPARLGMSVQKKLGRMEFVRASIRKAATGEITILPLSRQGSHMVGGMAQADCLLFFPEKREELAKGEDAMISPLRWGIL